MERCVATLAYACQDETLTIDCGQEVVHVINANYGRLGTELCPANIQVENVECADNRTADIVKDRCSVRRAVNKIVLGPVAPSSVNCTVS